MDLRVPFILSPQELQSEFFPLSSFDNPNREDISSQQTQAYSFPSANLALTLINLRMMLHADIIFQLDKSGCPICKRSILNEGGLQERWNR
jgi:hypothetical protein